MTNKVSNFTSLCTSLALRMREPKIAAATIAMGIALFTIGILAMQADGGINLGSVLNHVGTIGSKAAYSFMGVGVTSALLVSYCLLKRENTDGDGDLRFLRDKEASHATFVPKVMTWLVPERIVFAEEKVSFNDARIQAFYDKYKDLIDEMKKNLRETKNYAKVQTTDKCPKGFRGYALSKGYYFAFQDPNVREIGQEAAMLIFEVNLKDKTLRVTGFLAMIESEDGPKTQPQNLAIQRYLDELDEKNYGQTGLQSLLSEETYKRVLVDPFTEPDDPSAVDQ